MNQIQRNQASTDSPRASSSERARANVRAEHPSIELESVNDIAPTPRYPQLLRMLGDEDRAFLLSRATVKLIKKGQLLYHQGDPSTNVFIVAKGIVKVIYLTGGGSCFTTNYYREGMVVGAHGVTEWGGSHSWSAQSVVDTQLLCLKRSDLVELSDKSLHAMKALMCIWEFKAEQLKRVIRILATPKLEERILIALAGLSKFYGVRCGDGIAISEQFTRQEIAEMMGASRQSATMLLIGLEKSGHIRRDGRKIVLLSRFENLTIP